jgi:hypothetical protein
MVVGGCSCGLTTHPRFNGVLPVRDFSAESEVCAKDSEKASGPSVQAKFPPWVPERYIHGSQRRNELL